MSYVGELGLFLVSSLLTGDFTSSYDADRWDLTGDFVNFSGPWLSCATSALGLAVTLLLGFFTGMGDLLPV